jgi:hypothetical protein
VVDTGDDLGGWIDVQDTYDHGFNSIPLILRLSIEVGQWMTSILMIAKRTCHPYWPPGVLARHVSRRS